MNISGTKKACIALALAFSSVAATAAIYQSHVYTYYSNSSKTVEVGVKYTSCGTVNSYSDGQETPYYTVVSTACSSNGGGSGAFCRYYPDDIACEGL
ncbi:MAG: hypothetical protein HRT35_03955 [Algicola sp.]|nr:hypothetical protein [Algicola sp.]